MKGVQSVVVDLSERIVASVLWTFSMVLATAVSAQVSIPLPFTPVPFTLQVFSVLLTGLLLSPFEALLAQASYVGLGLLGVPWFSSLSALRAPFALFSPTFGYLLGFVVAAPLVALLLPRVGSVRATFAGVFVIHFLGALHLAQCLDLDVNSSLVLGVFPFLPLDLIKAILAIRVSDFLRTRAFVARWNG